MRDIHITDNSGGGGGGFEALALVAGIVVVAVVALKVAAAIAAAVAAVLLAIFWCLAALAGLAAVAGVTYVVLRLRRGWPPRRMDRPGLVTVSRPSQPAVITDAPRRAQLNGQAPRMHPADLAELARQIRSER